MILIQSAWYESFNFSLQQNNNTISTDESNIIFHCFLILLHFISGIPQAYSRPRPFHADSTSLWGWLKPGEISSMGTQHPAK